MSAAREPGSIEPPSPRGGSRRLGIAAWRAEGLARFHTADARLWFFVCPACGQEQSGRDYAALGMPSYWTYLARWCVGSANLNVPARADQVVSPGATTKGFGCTFRPIPNTPAPIELVLDDGTVRQTFEFAPS